MCAYVHMRLFVARAEISANARARAKDRRGSRALGHLKMSNRQFKFMIVCVCVLLLLFSARSRRRDVAFIMCTYRLCVVCVCACRAGPFKFRSRENPQTHAQHSYVLICVCVRWYIRPRTLYRNLSARIFGRDVFGARAFRAILGAFFCCCWVFMGGYCRLSRLSSQISAYKCGVRVWASI